jgi:hypothetical protein
MPNEAGFVISNCREKSLNSSRLDFQKAQRRMAIAARKANDSAARPLIQCAM